MAFAEDIEVEQDEDGFTASATVPEAQGFVLGCGATREEAIADLKAGIEALLEGQGISRPAAPR